MTLADGQYSFDGFVLGDGTDYYVQRAALAEHRVRESDAERPDGPGLFLGPEWPAAVPVILDVRIVGTGVADAWSKYDDLTDAWTTRAPEGFVGSAPLVFKRHGQAQRRTGNGRPRGIITDPSRIRKTNVIDCSLTFQAETPFEYSDTEHVTDLVINTVTPTANVTLGNAGNYPAPVTWDVYGQVTDPGVIRSEADRFDLDTAIGDLDWYRVRTDAKTVTRASDGHSLYQTWVAGSVWLEIPAGGALFRAVGSTPVSAAVKVRATWRDTWWY